MVEDWPRASATATEKARRYRYCAPAGSQRARSTPLTSGAMIVILPELEIADTAAFGEIAPPRLVAVAVTTIEGVSKNASA